MVIKEALEFAFSPMNSSHSHSIGENAASNEALVVILWAVFDLLPFLKNPEIQKTLTLISIGP